MDKPAEVRSLTVEKKKDLQGQRFGRWTVQNAFEITPRNERKWLCRCDCGTERYVLERSLRHGGSVSCGCLRKERLERTNSQDLTGKQFGELLVIRRVENSRYGAKQWLCRCSCGGEYTAQTTHLLTGRRTRCSNGIHEKNYAYSDISGQRFGRLTAISPTKKCDPYGSLIWLCRCDCAEETEISYNNLVYGNQRSCGCQKKEHSEKLQTFLTHVAGTSVDILKSKKIPTDNTTGYKGVYFVRGKYMAKIVFQKKQYFLGSYDRIEDAAEARREAEEVLFDGVTAHYKKWEDYSQKDPEWAKKNPVRVIVNRAERRFTVTLLPDMSML